MLILPEISVNTIKTITKKAWNQYLYYLSLKYKGKSWATSIFDVWWIKSFQNIRMQDSKFCLVQNTCIRIWVLRVGSVELDPENGFLFMSCNLKRKKHEELRGDRKTNILCHIHIVIPLGKYIGSYSKLERNTLQITLGETSSIQPSFCKWQTFSHKPHKHVRVTSEQQRHLYAKCNGQ